MPQGVVPSSGGGIVTPIGKNGRPFTRNTPRASTDVTVGAAAMAGASSACAAAVGAIALGASASAESPRTSKHAYSFIGIATAS